LRFCSFALHEHIAHFSFVITDPLVDLLSDIAVRFGGDCTKSALESRFRRLRSDAVLINKAVAKGINPITINVGGTDGQVAVKSGKGSHGQTFSNSVISTLYVFILLDHMQQFIN
jgi:hypothetical protein